jgi:hypothetical protein
MQEFVDLVVMRTVTLYLVTIPPDSDGFEHVLGSNPSKVIAMHA